MTRKDYKAIAKILRDAELTGTRTWKIAKELSAYFQSENPKFDKDKFISAIIDAPSK